MSFKYLYLTLWSLEQLNIGNYKFWSNIYAIHLKPQIDNDKDVIYLKYSIKANSKRYSVNKLHSIEGKSDER